MIPDASCENRTGRRRGKGRKNAKEKDKTESSILVHTYMHRCAAKKKGRTEHGKHARCADTLIGHEQTMYSACFILSRFINVNIFRPETTLLSPLLLIFLARFPGGEKQA